MAITGPSAKVFKLLSVTMVAISMMTSVSGFSPVISKSIQIRFCGFCICRLLGVGSQFSLGRQPGVLNSRPFYLIAAFSIRNTHGKRQLNRRQNWRIEKIQGERAARAAKRESSAVEALEGGDLGPEQTGLVIAHFGVQVEVE